MSARRQKRAILPAIAMETQAIVLLYSRQLVPLGITTMPQAAPHARWFLQGLSPQTMREWPKPQLLLISLCVWLANTVMLPLLNALLLLLGALLRILTTQQLLQAP